MDVLNLIVKSELLSLMKEASPERRNFNQEMVKACDICLEKGIWYPFTVCTTINLFQGVFLSKQRSKLIRMTTHFLENMF